MRVPDCAVAVGVRCQDGFSVRAKHTCIHETGVSAQFAERLPRRDFPHARVIARADDQRSLPIPAELDTTTSPPLVGNSRTSAPVSTLHKRATGSPVAIVSTLPTSAIGNYPD
jgi:hypothetical protein